MEAVRHRARGALLALGALGAGCAEEAAPLPPPAPLSALLITLDTTRADALSCYGAPEGTTPNLDRIAAEGVRYDQAHTVVPLTLPAHGSMLTGLYPPRHGVRDNGLVPLPASAETLAEAARDGGLQTGAFVSAAVLDRRFGLDQGFDVYVGPERTGAEVDHFEELPADRVIDGALEWLVGRDPERRFFLWVHLFDPHGPYEPPADILLRHRRDPYRGEVAFADRELGRLLDALRADGTLDGTLVFVVADHGEAFGEHGEVSHGSYCWETTLRVPLIVRYPDGFGAGTTSDEVVSVVDVYPTLRDALVLPTAGSAADVDGISLFRRRVPDGRGVYFECFDGWLSYGWSPLAGWLDRDGKYMHSSRPQLFDVRADPGEKDDLVSERDVGRYRDAIGRVAALPVLEHAEGVALDPELRADIQALGYAALGDASTEFPHPLAPSDRPSPAERAEEQARTLQATHLLTIGLVEQAERTLAGIVAENPRNYFALEKLAYCRVRLERYAEALAPLRRLVAEGPGWAGPHFNLGVCLRETGEPGEALGFLRRAVELDPSNPLFRRTLDELEAELGGPPDGQGDG